MRTLSQLRRLVIATFAFLGAGLIVPVVDAMWPSVWTIFLGGAVTVVSFVAVVAALHVWSQAGDAGKESRPDHPDDEGGGGPRCDWPVSPPPGGSGSDPSWWPEFERRLALYVAEREMENRQPAAERN